MNQRRVFWAVFWIVCGRQCHRVLKAEHSMRVGRSRRMHARPWTCDISVADTLCCQQSTDWIVSGCRQWRRLCQRGTPGTYDDERRASSSTVYAGCTGVSATSATDAGPVTWSCAWSPRTKTHSSVLYVVYRGDRWPLTDHWLLEGN